MMEGRLSFWQRVQLACGAPRIAQGHEEAQEEAIEPTVVEPTVVEPTVVEPAVVEPAVVERETWCPVCFLSWEEQSDWHGLRPAGEAELCDPHMRRLADFAGDDRGFAQRVILRLHIRAERG